MNEGRDEALVQNDVVRLLGKGQEISEVVNNSEHM